MSQSDELVRYQEACQKFTNSFEYTWFQTRVKFNELITKSRTVLNVTSQEHIEDAYAILEDGIVPTVIQYNLKTFPSVSSLQNQERLFFQSILQALTDLFKELFQAYLENSGYIRGDEDISKLSNKFNTINMDLRYPRQQIGANGEWSPVKTRELLRTYDGIISIIRLTRNLAMHMTEQTTRSYLRRVRRTISEPIIGTESPGGYFMVVSLVTVAIHEFIAILQTWIDTSEISPSQPRINP